MIPTIYLVISVAYILFLVSVFMESEIITILTGMLMMSIAVFIFINGIDIFNNFASIMIAGVTFGLGSYIAVRSSIELIK